MHMQHSSQKCMHLKNLFKKLVRLGVTAALHKVLMFQEQLESQMQQLLTAAEQQLHSKAEATAELEAGLQEAQQQLQQQQVHVKQLDDALHAAQAAVNASKQELKQKEQAQRSLLRETQSTKEEVQRLRQQLTRAQGNSSADSESALQASDKVCRSRCQYACTCP